MSSMKKLGILAACVLLSVFLCLNHEAFARGGGGSSGGHSSSGGFSSGGRSSGGGFSGSSSSSSGGWGSSSKSSSSSSSDWGSSKSTDSGSSWGVTKSPSSTPNVGSSATDKALYDKAKMSGTAFSTRDEAVKSFQAKNADKFSSKFTTEPSTRPAYIPPSTTVGGQNYTVVYSPGFGGYGYYMNGQWMMYDVMRDVAMTSALMHQNQYYYGAPPASHGVLFYILMVLLLFLAVGFLIYLLARD